MSRNTATESTMKNEVNDLLSFEEVIKTLNNTIADLRQKGEKAVAFLASDFVRTNELPHLLKTAKNDGATILPLILKPCRFSKNKKLSVFQAVNDPAKPLSKLTEDEQDEILLKLTDRIAELM